MHAAPSPSPPPLPHQHHIPSVQMEMRCVPCGASGGHQTTPDLSCPGSHMAGQGTTHTSGKARQGKETNTGHAGRDRSEQGEKRKNFKREEKNESNGMTGREKRGKI
ncbi:hypothetical protein Pcinc_034707 [Petrolisthes cinctipes]|uniref:Uncharacterized protein n=1 Tax=Petrolisthes cinctipes TaxID=88211 RepID=A0AAE1BY57_PETCI|nr:hypothetical protein Pcinc_034707 [Petrolisthes cinctipes]